MPNTPSTTDITKLISTINFGVFVSTVTRATNVLHPSLGFETVPLPTKAEGTKINVTSIGDSSIVEQAGIGGARTLAGTLFLHKGDAAQKLLQSVDGTSELIDLWALSKSSAPPTLPVVTNPALPPAVAPANTYAVIRGSLTNFNITGERDNVLKIEFAMAVASVTNTFLD